jgi:biuret amidohydrolase
VSGASYRAVVELDALTTAVLTMEMQRGVCGPDAGFPALRDAVAERAVAKQISRLSAAAREAGAIVVHCTFSLRPDRAGTDLRLPLMRAARHDPTYLLQGSAPTELLDEITAEPGDLFVDRHHGVSPFGGTELHELLSARRITDVVVSGVSLNVGIPGTVIEAVNAGYRVVVATDAVVGVPVDYGDQVLRNSLAAIATLADTATVIAALGHSGS